METSGFKEAQICVWLEADEAAVSAGEGAADGADAGAEEERGVSERSPPLREESQGADVPGLIQRPPPPPPPPSTAYRCCCVLFILVSLSSCRRRRTVRLC